MDCAYVPAATRSIRSVITLTVVLVVISALMLDPETDTYSLSKFQFYLWTFAVVLGYSYLSLVRSLIQGTFEFSDVPTDLPGILIVSVGTAVISTGVTSAVGSKGAGRVQPGWADLLTSGEVVIGAGAAGAGAVVDSGEATDPAENPEISVTNADGQMAAWPVVIRTE